MLPPTFRNAGAFRIPAYAGLRLLGMTVWPFQTDTVSDRYRFRPIIEKT